MDPVDFRTVPAQAKPPTVLVVDDDEGLLLLVGNALRGDGSRTIVTIPSGLAALDWLRKQHADLMLVDLKLADVDAGELVRRLQSIGRSVPFIIMTGQGDERVAVDMMKRGARDYLIKDANFLEFVPAVIQNVLGQLAKETRLAEAEAVLRRNEALLAQSQQIAHVGSYELNLVAPGEGHWSPEAFRILGLDSAKTALTFSDYLERIVHPEDVPRVQEAFDRSISEGTSFDLQYRIMRPDGSLRYVHGIAEPLRGPDQKFTKFVGTLQDVTERKELEQEILEISEREQSRIGQDLHDGLCQHLAGIEFRLLSLKQQLEGKSNKQAAMANELARLVRDAIEQTRTLARGLSPVMLEPAGLMHALHELAIHTEKTFTLGCAFHCPVPVFIHDNAVATHLYRIAQEAVHNAVRHGKAKAIRVSLINAQGRVVLAVSDNGVGLPHRPQPHKGMGLRIMQYRAGMVGGSLAVQREATGGTSVICSLTILRTDAQDKGEDEAISGQRG